MGARQLAALAAGTLATVTAVTAGLLVWIVTSAPAELAFAVEANGVRGVAVAVVSRALDLLR